MPDPVTTYNTAAAAYSRAANSAGGGIEPRDTGGDDDFAALVKGAIEEAVRIGKTSERQSIAAINDRADLNEVVTAVAEAEVTLQTVVAVRDKVIEAYKDIIRMPM